MKIRGVASEDWQQVKTIYQLGIDTGVATFETAPPETYNDWITKLDLDNTFVAEENSSILGWITLSKVSNRCVYEGVGEISIYIHPEYKRKKVGARLYSHLEENAKFYRKYSMDNREGEKASNDLDNSPRGKRKRKGYWTIQAQLFTENTASKSFFEDRGFRKVGIREKIGKLDNEWIDNYLYEKNFN